MRLVIDAEYLERHEACEDWRAALVNVLPITLTGDEEADREEAVRVMADPLVWREILDGQDVRVDCRCGHCSRIRAADEDPRLRPHQELLPVGWVLRTVNAEVASRGLDRPWPSDRRISSLSAWLAAIPECDG